MKYRIKAMLASAAMILTTAGCAGNAGAKTAVMPVQITVFSVGKADAILIQAEDSVIMIDSGESDDEGFLLSELKKRGITHLDLLEITHFDKDHVGSAAAVVRALDIDRIIFPDYEGIRNEYYSFMEAIKGNAASEKVNENISITFGKTSLDIFPAPDPESIIAGNDEYDNDLSLVTRMSYGNEVFLFCGDIENDRIKQMKKQDIDWNCDWIKLPHHGKYCKQLDDLMELCTPAFSVMTVSEDEPADSRTVDLLAQFGVQSFDTLSSDVITESDGQSITVANK